MPFVRRHCLDCRTPRSAPQQNGPMRTLVRGCEPGRHSTRHEEVDGQQVWSGQGGQEVDNDPSRILGSLECPRRSSLEEHAELVCNLGDLENISVCQACTGLADVPATGIRVSVAEEVPVGDGVCTEVGVLLNIGNTVEVVGV